MFQVKELKNDTKKGKLHKKLYNCLNKPPTNEKKTQTANTFKESCQCVHNKRKRRHRVSVSPKQAQCEDQLSESINDNLNRCNDHTPGVANLFNNTLCPPNSKDYLLASEHLPLMQVHSDSQAVNQYKNFSPMVNKRMSVESQDSDELMIQLEKLFQGDTNDDDLFEGALYDKLDTAVDDHSKKSTNILDTNKININKDSVIEDHAAQIKSLDERLANLAGLLVNNDNIQQKTENSQKNRKSGSSKWLCEEYHLKQKLHELLDQIGDHDRKLLEKV